MKAQNCFISASYINNSYGSVELPLRVKIQLWQKPLQVSLLLSCSGLQAWHHRGCFCPPAVDGSGCFFSYSAKGRNSCPSVSCCNDLKSKVLKKKKKRQRNIGKNLSFEMTSYFGHKIASLGW